MKLYEIRLDGGECYYSLGIFDSISSVRRIIAERDGPSVSGNGGPLTDHGDDGESGVVMELESGRLYRDCCGPGEVVMTFDRDWRVPDPENPDDDRYDDDDRIWTTKWSADRMEGGRQIIDDLIGKQMETGAVSVRQNTEGARELRYDPSSYSMDVMYGDGTVVTIHPRAFAAIADAIRERRIT